MMAAADLHHLPGSRRDSADLPLHAAITSTPDAFGAPRLKALA